MRLLEKVERSFIAKMVEETRDLMDSTKPVFVKVAWLQLQAARQGQRIEGLRRLQIRMGLDDIRKSKVQELIELRAKVMGYLRATAKFLVHAESHPNTLRQPPSLYAMPYWQPVASLSTQPEHPEYPFMEYSS